ncbi:protein kinase [bacterium]|nr:protein kinase [bacterium]
MIGSGGMGTVYRAQDTRLDRFVALKFLPAHLSQSAEDKKRFIHEARATSALDHPNICTIHEINESEEGQLYIAMACYEGESLKDRISRGPLPVKDAMDIAVQIARGLDKAHAKGIVHRDVKPANILITEDGTAKIVDFGLAKLADRSLLTKEGTTLGTVAYMSPEQARGDAVDQRTDIWALGVILFEMLTGERPFKGDYEQAVIYSILNEEPGVMADLRPDLPPFLEGIVCRALEKEPDTRYATMADFLDDLIALQTGTLPEGLPGRHDAKHEQNRRRLLRYGVPAVLIVLVLLGYFLFQPGKEETHRLKMIAVLPFENLGPAEDEYFADGLTEEITSRLSSVRNLGVISRTSAEHYKKSSKPLPVIAKELGVDYVLEGTIRWVKSGNLGRIRITPKLIQVTDDVQLWAGNMDRTMEDIFAIQTDIATQVVKSLDIVLNETERLSLAMIPTKNLDAYQAYLQCLSVSIYERSGMEKRIELCQRAVELDSTFVLAYLSLSTAHLRYYWFGFDRSQERLSAAKAALDRAFALQSDMPEAYYVLGIYYYFGFRNYPQALRSFAIAEKRLPNSSRILTAVAYIWRRQGKFAQALEKQKKGFELDPKNLNTLYEIGVTLSWLGRFSEAETYFDRYIALSSEPVWPYIRKADIDLLRSGDTKESRNDLDRIQSDIKPWAHLAWLDMYERTYTAALERLDRVAENSYEYQYSITPVFLLRGLIYRLLDDKEKSVASFDSARSFLLSQINKNPDDDRLYSALGIAYAGLGQPDEAVREAERAVDLLPLSADALRGMYPLIALTQVYVMVGRYEDALEKLDFLLSPEVPKVITAQILRLDPLYDPLRNHPKFQALLARGGVQSDTNAPAETGKISESAPAADRSGTQPGHVGGTGRGAP